MCVKLILKCLENAAQMRTTLYIIFLVTFPPPQLFDLTVLTRVDGKYKQHRKSVVPFWPITSTVTYSYAKERKNERIFAAFEGTNRLASVPSPAHPQQDKHMLCNLLPIQKQSPQE